MKDVIIVKAEDMKSSYNSQLLAHLEDIKEIRFGDTINFSTNTRFEGDATIPVIEAFNIYLRRLSRNVSRIIINL